MTREAPSKIVSQDPRLLWGRCQAIDSQIVRDVVHLAVTPPVNRTTSRSDVFRALGGADTPHPPVPQCQVVEEEDPPHPDSIGDGLHGLATSDGQPIECLLVGVESCPTLTIGVPSPGVMFATTTGLEILDHGTIKRPE